MLTREDDIDVHALRRQGWTISAIARHLGKDRKTIRAYLSGRAAGVRATSWADPFDRFGGYCAQRLKDDPHLWASTLFDELLELGYDRSYPTMTRQLRARGLRPACEPCRPTKDRAVALIEHPAGEEIQWDWVELPDPPEHWGWGKNAHLLVGALAIPGVGAACCVSPRTSPTCRGLDRISRALGGLTRDWRFDRMATVISPESGKVSASFSAVAKHYGLKVRPCPPRRGNRKGVVEKANHVAAQRFWRTLPDDVSVQEAQERLDAWCTKRGDTRIRSTTDGKASVATPAATEPLAAVPTPFPALLSVARVVSAQALVSFRGNRYSVPPELHGATVTLSVRLGSTHLDIASSPNPGRTSARPVILARHLIAATGAGATIRDHGHVLALERAAMAASTTERPHRRKERRPPSPAARAQAATLAARDQPAGAAGLVVDLTAYAAAAAGRNTLTPAQPTPSSETFKETKRQ